MPPRKEHGHPSVSSPSELLARLDGMDLILPVERLFDDLPNVVFFVKDPAGRYICVNQTLAQRCGLREKSALLGKKPSALFPEPLASRYERQDQKVLQSGKPILHQLELHFYPGHQRGWCLTNKYPVMDRVSGGISALMGISRDVETSARGVEARGFPELARALECLHERIENPPSMDELACLCGLSVPQLSQMVQRLFHLTPGQLAMKLRLDEALHLLATTEQSITDVALATGFCDQSAFTRHFRRFAGVPPGTFRAQYAESEAPRRVARKGA